MRRRTVTRQYGGFAELDRRLTASPDDPASTPIAGQCWAPVDNGAGAAGPQQPANSPDQVHEQGREIPHGEQRSPGTRERNPWIFRALALQNSTWHPTRIRARSSSAHHTRRPRESRLAQEGPISKTGKYAESISPSSYELAAIDYNPRIAGESPLIEWRKYRVHSC